MSGSERMPFADRTHDIAPFLAMEVMERGMAMSRQGVDIVQFGVGEPDFDAPTEVVAATMRALESGGTHYTDSRGLFSLRDAIAEDCHRRRGVEVDPDQVLITSGTSPAIFMCLSSLVNPGDEVILATPHYPCYPNMVRLCGGRPVLIPTGPADGFVIDVGKISAAITQRTRAIILASPANPTGAVQPPEVVEAIAALGLPVLSDEIYDGLIFGDAKLRSPLGLNDDVYILDGFSKRYAMTGFRLGYVIAPKKATRLLQNMQQNLFISVAQFVQEAGIAALEHGAGHVEAMRAEYDKRRRLVVEGLREMGFSIPVDPQGAFYVLVDASKYGQDSLALSFDILEKARVALGPGRDFGEIAEGFLRFSYATATDRIEEGLRRLDRYLAKGV